MVVEAVQGSIRTLYRRPGERLWPAHRYTVTVILHLAHISPASFVHCSYQSILLPTSILTRLYHLSPSFPRSWDLPPSPTIVRKCYMCVEFRHLVDTKRSRNQRMHIDRAIVIGTHAEGMRKENKRRFMNSWSLRNDWLPSPL